MATNGDNLRWKMEEIYRRKKQVFLRIKQGSDGNWTEIGRPKVTEIDYNTLAPFNTLFNLYPQPSSQNTHGATGSQTITAGRVKKRWLC